MIPQTLDFGVKVFTAYSLGAGLYWFALEAKLNSDIWVGTPAAHSFGQGLDQGSQPLYAFVALTAQWWY